MNIRDLEYLVALAEHQHFRKAAESCFVSQPTLSGQIRKLEDEIGTALLERNSRKVLFTDSGLQLVEQAKIILSEVTRFKDMASGQSGEMVGPMNIGFIPTVGPYILPRIIPQLKAAYPELEMFLHESQTHELVRQLQDGKLDCLVLASVAETAPFKEIELYNEPLALAVPSDHEWAGLEFLNVDELNGRTVLMLGDGHCLRDQALGYCFAAGAKEDKRFKATSLETLRNMVAAGGGITLLPELSVPKESTKDGVCYVKKMEPQPSRKIVLVYRPGSPLRARFEQLGGTIQSILQA
ncbi:DNA-binding transcriptional regulator OxyR [Vibrio genomosp. F10]|uniref:DNA-binding transcriptional regulator OxyR n=2 Tax=Vibrio genomosp. F10 TaxID=723171 RepID=A0A1B9R1W3_9VIBR|nr:DNA-binding transcriptional regulator OxyR [Vibrio genomosp. F10]OCH78263.1 DNA-binding transcriptional regulator OxyR [Vibrio genomosp. F10]OEE33195.1 DNA-binding transcriptional regulator OxyR [Vibrio genomosp. F10 str. ZF-129]OEE92782.1 DNA-binding transcriptional regulator OxyR [Vibrio genomosp. F10 str. 9ZC157]OEE95547.1 DNA-binding transcriptional regulator OxyR [Vibrio genomosp. F10 str. 9ZD137]OEF06166.1 DNA-binding transcriptional regulator OxyR [Vibrio genomosp. F10 str. 9ZB36]